ncbi:MAG: GMC family oxidoreductase [Steroidobacteraceae bacterium]
MNGPSFDAIVIGSGAGGAAAAARLVEGGLSVLLLEKGGELPTDGSTLDVERVVHQGAFLSREPWRDGRGRPLRPEEHFNVGGKTRWYGAALLRFAAREFDAEPAYGCRAWPLRAAQLAPYYEEAERRLGVRLVDCEPGLARIRDSLLRPGRGWQASPLPLGLAPAILDHPHEASHFDGFASVLQLKRDADTAFLAGLRSHPGLRLETGAEVVELLGAPDDPLRITGVRLGDGRCFAGRRVLLAAGALHSPRLLARYLGTHGLDRSLPAAAHVGRHLKLHLLTAMLAVGPRRQRDVLRKTVVFTHPAHPHSSVQPLGFDGELMATLVPRPVPRALARAIGTHAYGFFLQTEEGSDPRNRVVESGEGPVLDYDPRRQPASLHEHRAFTWRLRRDLARAGLVSFTQRIGLAGTAHACGTLVAGADAATSVVDAAGRVHGLRGMYVTDGSVLPRSSRVNPSLSIYAWALHVATELLRERTAARASSPPAALEENADAY